MSQKQKMGAKTRPSPAANAGKRKPANHTAKQTKGASPLGKRRASEELARPKKVHTKDAKTKYTSQGKYPGKSFTNSKFTNTKHAARPQNGQRSIPVPEGPLTRKQRKEIAHAKLSATKKNFNLIQTAIQQWEKARPKATSEDDRKKLVADLVAKIKGKVMELANHHSASRVIQFCLKHGSTKDKQTVMAEIKPSVVDLARSKYGHYLARKLVNIASKEEVPGLVKLFRGQAVSLARHPHATDVLMDLYDVASTSERNAIRAEFYGREYALFDGVQTQAAGLTGPQQLLEGATGAKRKAIFQHMYKSLMPIMEKALLHPPMVHRLLRDFLLTAPTSLVEDAVDTLCQTGGEVFKMVHTHEGAEAVCMLLAYGSAKDRRHLLKGMKGYVKEISCNEWGHAAMCTAVSCVDDTTLLKKIVIQELQSSLSKVIDHKHGCKVLLQLLSPDNPRYMPPHVLSMLHPPTRMTTTKQSAAVGADFGAQLHSEQDFDAGGDGVEDMEEDGDFGGLDKVGSKKKKAANGKPVPVKAQKSKEAQDEEDEDEDEDEEEQDEDEDHDDEDEEEDVVGDDPLADGGHTKQKHDLFEGDEDEDEDGEGDDEDEDGGDEEEEAGATGKKGKKGGVLKEIPWNEVEALLGGDDGDEDEDEDGEEEEEDGGFSGQQMGDANAGEEEGPREPTVLGLSRKDSATRRRELLSGGKSSLAQKLCNTCSEGAGDFLRHPVTCDLVVEVCRGGSDGVLASICPKGVTAVHDAVLKEAAKSKSGADTDEVGPAPGPALQHVLEDYYGSRALRRLVLHASEHADGKRNGAGEEAGKTGSKGTVSKGEDDGGEGEEEEEVGEERAAAVEFVSRLWSEVLKGRCKEWVGSHADKVLSAFVFVEDEGVRKAVLKELKGLVKGDVMKWAQTFVRGDVIKSKQ